MNLYLTERDSLVRLYNKYKLNRLYFVIIIIIHPNIMSI